MDRTRTTALLAFALAFAGCKEMGINGDWASMEAPDDRPSTDLVTAGMQRVETAQPRLIMDGKLWLPSGYPLDVSDGDLRAVGTANGATVYARAWDRPPYDDLFTQVPAQATEPLGQLDGVQWQSYAPVMGRSGPSPDPAAAPAGGHEQDADTGH